MKADAAEPVADVDSSETGFADSASAEPDPAPGTRGDILRSLLVGALVALCVARPSIGLLVAPFLPAVIALRLLRGAGEQIVRVGAVQTAAAAAAVAAGARLHPAIVVACGMAGALVWVLASVHERAARPDPPEAAAWPEPTVSAGFTRALLAWIALAAVTCIVVVLLLGNRGVSEAAVGVVRDSYSVYTEGCAPGGSLASQAEFCERMRDQRLQMEEVAKRHGIELLAALAATIAIGAAATAHLFVLWRARRRGLPVRPARRLRELEVHWSAAYVLAAGLLLLLAADVGGTTLQGLRGIAVALVAAGGTLIAAQGLGFAAWITTCGRTPGWYRWMLVVVAMFVAPVALGVLFTLGVVDMALHPRRRASGSLPGRGPAS